MLLEEIFFTEMIFFDHIGAQIMMTKVKHFCDFTFETFKAENELYNFFHVVYKIVMCKSKGSLFGTNNRKSIVWVLKVQEKYLLMMFLKYWSTIA